MSAAARVIAMLCAVALTFCAVALTVVVILDRDEPSPPKADLFNNMCRNEAFQHEEACAP